MNPLDELRLTPEEAPQFKWPRKTTGADLIDAQLNKCLRALMPMLTAIITPLDYRTYNETRRQIGALVAAWEAKHVKP